LIQEGCPYSQQELRTILFQQGEYDGYLLRHQKRLCSSNPFDVLCSSKPLEVTSFVNHASKDLFFTPLFEFHGKRHFMEFYLNFKMAKTKRGFKVGSMHFKGKTRNELEIKPS